MAALYRHKYYVNADCKPELSRMFTFAEDYGTASAGGELESRGMDGGSRDGVNLPILVWLSNQLGTKLHPLPRSR